MDETGGRAASGEAFPLAYCAGGWETVRRFEALYGPRRAEGIAVAIEVPTAAMRRFRAAHADGFCEYPDPQERIAFWDAHLRQRAAVADDSMPSVYPSEMDQGLYGGLLGGDVRFLCDTQSGRISSMVAPLFARIEQATGLSLDRGHPWWRRYVQQLEVYAAAAAGRFGVSHFILVDGLNFLFECVGATNTYLALADAPDRVAELIDFAFELNAAIHERFFRTVGLTAGGTCSNMLGFCPGRIVSQSVDPFHMTRTADFDRWGRQPAQRIFDRFDGGCLHLHANGRHLLEAVAELDGLVGIYMGDDRGYPPAFAVLEDLQARVRGVPLAVSVPHEAFVAALDGGRLPGGVYYRVAGCPDVATANRTMDRVRAVRERAER